MPTCSFPGRYESLAQICAFISGMAEKAGLSDSATYAVQLAVDEACSNIVEHAYGKEGIGDIQCTCEVDDGNLKIVLQDQGRPFDPNVVPEPARNAPLDEVKPGGAGLFLMRKLMDEVHFEFTLDRGNILTMIKRKG
jgi:serine/threonine-protein kinase RsbW